MADLGRQLELQRQINKALVDRQALLEKNAQSLTKQANLAKEVCKALQCKDLEGMERRLGQINNQLRQVSNHAEKGADGMQNMTERAKEAESAFEKVHKKGLLIAGGIGALKGAVGVFKNFVGLLKGGIRLAGTFAKGIWGIGKAIISIPFRILGGLIDLAQRGGGISELKVALEEVRKEFGNLKVASGKSLRDSIYGMRGAFNKTAASGFSFRKIFGRGRKGLAAALKETTEMAKGMGPAFETFHTQLGPKAAADLVKYRRGLGMTAETQGQLIKKAQAAGKDYKKMFAEIGIPE